MKYLHALNKIFGVGPQKMKMLINHLGSPQNVWTADLGSLMASGIGPKLAERIFYERNSINPKEEWEKLEKENIKMMTINDEDYPRLLLEAPGAPYIIYTRGNFDINSLPLVAIVGSRKYTQYGAQVASTFARELAQVGIGIVSGMALGIDSFAHRGALDADGKTIAVLGNSLDEESIYPRNNVNLSREIAQRGLLVSEYPPVTLAGKLTFPARNRIIAGLSIGVLVVEAGEKSGALLTAQMALDFNREVFSVPGSIFSPQSIGTHELLKHGARLVSSVSDILSELEIFLTHEKKPSVPKKADTKEEETILGMLTHEPIHIDNIRKITKLNMATVSGTLSVMEIKGWAKNIGGQNYILL
jgi:DNA processing protein